MKRYTKNLVAGVDLAGSQERRTGFCILNTNNSEAIVKTIYKTKDIIDEIVKTKPKIIAIDAPLSLPSGRKSLSTKYKKGPHFRLCDLELKRLKIKFFPITLGPMRKLTKRGIMLKKKLENKHFKVIETYPGAVQDILKIPRKKKGKINTERGLMKGLMKLGIKLRREKEKQNDKQDNNINDKNKNINHDELDAVTCAWLAKLYLEGKTIALGDKHEGLLYIPAE